MSHVVAIKTRILDLEALKEACPALGLEFIEGQRTFKWYGTHVGDYKIPEGFSQQDMGHCEHAIRVKGAGRDTYEVGVVKSREGEGYQLMWDFWNGGYGLQNHVGKDCSNLLTGYAEKVADKALAKSCRRVEEWTDELGNKHIKYKVKEQF